MQYAVRDLKIQLHNMQCVLVGKSSRSIDFAGAQYNLSNTTIRVCLDPEVHGQLKNNTKRTLVEHQLVGCVTKVVEKELHYTETNGKWKIQKYGKSHTISMWKYVTMAMGMVQIMQSWNRGSKIFPHNREYTMVYFVTQIRKSRHVKLTKHLLKQTDPLKMEQNPEFQ